MLTETNDIMLIQGIFDHGDHVEFLLDLWPELQRSFADATRAPDLDFFSFVQNSFYFAVIYHKKRPNKDSGQTNSSGDNAQERPFDSHNSNRAPGALTDDVFDDPTDYRPDVDPFSLVPVGFVVLNCSLDTSAPAGEMSIGVIIDKLYRRQGFAQQAVCLLMQWVFNEIKFHRLQAVIVDNPDKLSAFNLFMQLGFDHEGVRRRSVYSRAEQVWKDATHLAILDTDWVTRSYLRTSRRTLWDEMLSRHDRERQALLRSEELTLRTASPGALAPARMLKRSGSVETVRALSEAPEPSASTSGFASTFGCDARSSVSGSSRQAPGSSHNPHGQDDESEFVGRGRGASSLNSSGSGSLSSESSSVSLVGDSDIEDQNLLVDHWRAGITTPPPATPSVASLEDFEDPDSPIDQTWDFVDDPFTHAL